MASAHSHFPISTSSLEEDGCPSTLRDRLRDDDTPATSSSIGPIPYSNIYQQVHACLGKTLNTSKPESKVVHAPESNDQASQLRESYARMGMSLHSSAIDHLVKAHTDVQAKTAHFAEKSGQTLSQSKQLYANIAYPLAATLCHHNDHEDHPRATVAVHLKKLQEEIAAAREEAWKDLNKELADQGIDNGVDEEVLKAAEDFKAQAEVIVEEKCRLLDEVDKEFKAEIQNQTLKMMQDLFDD
ncbi:hypothetical protein FOPG_05338 [Fusarium oxysporum f. sp. conglutinans race 2 54008]|uniref:Uncharacterized protein n=2 Tax=Fusarium oxysporum f. sp. conglutinans TaxID=100902 RepID=F9FH17_FUSOF|nr:hypothetical protein FOXB_05696 [Fusarium oxysporum f. sp. conglutinans Fo5176]EXL81310.1 hypothetical protein FOPG_05338 [Fusarium oxysporum f. sp. conglutinans race 2 54008]KAG6995267.1 hypothetical protein FocnCong_v017292 [Fusarium oxysporum f. sp. conglutinans]KAI8407569.1 hypothetical protein FOFC_13007 [Fusarium oxysporum]KAJ4107922.1 hypothetical protein NW769_008888 [Fusarium oxysporum]